MGLAATRDFFCDRMLARTPLCSAGKAERRIEFVSETGANLRGGLGFGSVVTRSLLPKSHMGLFLEVAGAMQSAPEKVSLLAARFTGPLMRREAGRMGVFWGCDGAPTVTASTSFAQKALDKTP